MKIEAVGLTRLQLVLLLTSLATVAGMSTNIYIPSLPALTEDLNTDRGTAQYTLSAYFAGIAFAQLIYGPLSDRYGRRPILQFGFALFVGATILCALAPTIETLIWARLAQASGACVGQVIMRAVVRDLFDRSETASMMASIILAIALAPAAAPVLGAIIHTAMGWRWSFVFIAFFGIVVMFLAWRFLPETLKPENRISSGIGTMLAGYKILLTSPAFLGYSFCSMFIFAMMFAFQSNVPFIIIEQLGYSVMEFSLLGMIPVIGFIAGSFSAGRFTPRFGVDRMITIGMSITVAGMMFMLIVALVLPLSALSIFGSMTFVVLGMGMVFPNSSAAAVSVHPEIAGTSSALTGFLQMAGAGLAVSFVALLSTDTHMPLIYSMMGFAVLSAISPFVGRMLERRTGKGQSNPS
ncbi:MAG: multidrug effflux MFS transporter [Alphaproteobacteria bacterium]|nr:multidrug effflux MFS transporter [Alphaproteobacteria bacterium]MBT4085345.1 multidrug effflux MFS transporter [Alphaproteobacteria bacterium]MBT4544128.1 multidrug effflux MFS transporter [Alphaproteobacteria bacterium]MBT7744689.1 multidrug effflux MFS transporter [Alphaproteobacteria bacterium]